MDPEWWTSNVSGCDSKLLATCRICGYRSSTVCIQVLMREGTPGCWCNGRATWKGEQGRQRILSILAGGQLNFDSSLMSPEWWNENVVGANSRLAVTCKVCGHRNSSTLHFFSMSRKLTCKCSGQLPWSQAYCRISERALALGFRLLTGEDFWKAHGGGNEKLSLECLKCQALQEGSTCHSFMQKGRTCQKCKAPKKWLTWDALLQRAAERDVEVLATPADFERMTMDSRAHLHCKTCGHTATTTALKGFMAGQLGCDTYCRRPILERDWKQRRVEVVEEADQRGLDVLTTDEEWKIVAKSVFKPRFYCRSCKAEVTTTTLGSFMSAGHMGCACGEWRSRRCEVAAKAQENDLVLITSENDWLAVTTSSTLRLHCNKCSADVSVRLQNFMNFGACPCSCPTRHSWAARRNEVLTEAERREVVLETGADEWPRIVLHQSSKITLRCLACSTMVTTTSVATFMTGGLGCKCRGVWGRLWRHRYREVYELALARNVELRVMESDWMEDANSCIDYKPPLFCRTCETLVTTTNLQSFVRCDVLGCNCPNGTPQCFWELRYDDFCEQAFLRDVQVITSKQEWKSGKVRSNFKPTLLCNRCKMTVTTTCVSSFCAGRLGCDCPPLPRVNSWHNRYDEVACAAKDRGMELLTTAGEWETAGVDHDYCPRFFCSSCDTLCRTTTIDSYMTGGTRGCRCTCFPAERHWVVRRNDIVAIADVNDIEVVTSSEDWAVTLRRGDNPTFVCLRCHVAVTSTSVDNFHKRGAIGCACRFKTEKLLLRWLCDEFGADRVEYQPRACQNPDTMRWMRFDFKLHDKFVIELDGDIGHFGLDWNREPTASAPLRDVMKELMALRDGLCVVRLLQADVWTNRLNWRGFIRDAIGYLTSTDLSSCVLCQRSEMYSMGVYADLRSEWTRREHEDLLELRPQSAASS